MTYMLLAIAGLVLAVLALMVAASHRHKRLIPKRPAGPLRPSPHPQLQSLQLSGKYRGVRMESRCRAGQHLSNREFTLNDAPRIPVPGCDASVCECSYVGLPERRVNRERRCNVERRASRRAGSKDRRSGINRRRLASAPSTLD